MLPSLMVTYIDYKNSLGIFEFPPNPVAVLSCYFCAVLEQTECQILLFANWYIGQLLQYQQFEVHIL